MSRSHRHEIPGLESLEGRELLSVTALLARRAAARGAVAAQVDAPQPTRHEAARQAFVAKFSGRYIVGPGRFADQATSIYLSGGGTSNQFLHGDVQVGLATYKGDFPRADGTANLAVKNVSDTGNQLVLDLGSPIQVDSRGRPTRLTWTVSGSSGGSYDNATGSGTLDILYRPGGKRLPRSLETGNAGLIFTGQVYTSGVGNIARI